MVHKYGIYDRIYKILVLIASWTAGCCYQHAWGTVKKHLGCPEPSVHPVPPRALVGMDSSGDLYVAYRQ